jgi:hypothetical protein
MATGKELKMQDTTKERLAKEFAVAMREIREKKWPEFCSAADQANIDPYIALGVVLVRMMETTLDEMDVSRN